MQKPAIHLLVLTVLYPNPRSGDPTNLQAHVSRHIIPEVQEEIIRYFGSDDGLEAQYPGLDYTNDRHRRRLSWFPHHRQLFHAFDELRLTTSEIKSLCRWKGTLYLKEKFEQEAGTCIPDSAWPYSDPLPLKSPIAYLTRRRSAGSIPSILIVSGEALLIPEDQKFAEEQSALVEEDSENSLVGIEDMTDDEEEALSTVSSEDDTLSHSVGVELNQRLLAATAARARGEEAVLDPDWEQWLKEAAERDADTAATSFLLQFSHDFGLLSPVSSSNEPMWTDEIPEVFSGTSSMLTPTQLAAARTMMPSPPPYISSIRATAPLDVAAEGAEPQVGTAM